MMYRTSYSIGEHRLCRISMGPEKPDPREVLQSEPAQKMLQEKMGGWTELIRNLGDILRAWKDALNGIRNEPHMPRNNAGRIEIPALDGMPGSDDPEVRAELEKSLNDRYNSPKARTHFQHYPERYSRMQPPAPERIVPRGSPLRTGFNRTDGRYYEIWDAATQSYVKGPILQTFEQMQAQGTRNRRERAKDEARRRAAIQGMREWDQSRQDPIHRIRSAQRRMWASVGADPDEYVGGAVRDGNRMVAAEMEKFDRENPVAPGPEEVLTFEQSKSFQDLMRTEGIPHNVREDMKWWNDAAGSLVVWQRKGNAWEGFAIQRNGVTMRLGASEQAPAAVEQVAVAPAVEAAPSRAPRMNRERMANGFEQIRRETYAGMNNARIERGQQPFASFEQYNAFKAIHDEWGLKPSDEANGDFVHRFNERSQLEVWKRLPNRQWRYAIIDSGGRAAQRILSEDDMAPEGQSPDTPPNKPKDPTDDLNDDLDNLLV